VDDSLAAVILGIIEGLTEFLPISSTGHMIVAMPALGVNADAPHWKAFLYFVQIGAILAVIVYFWRSLWRHLLARPTAGWSSHLATKIVVGTVPAGIIGLTLDEFMEQYLEKPVPVAIALIVGAAAMWLIERARPGGRVERVEDISLSQAAWIGLAQCVSVVPGTSRAMATIMGGMLVGLKARAAAEFSFYLAIPTLCGAGLLRLWKHRAEIDAGSAGLLGLGFTVSFVVALLVVAAFMRYLRTRPLWPFALYRVVLGATVLVWWLSR